MVCKEQGSNKITSGQVITVRCRKLWLPLIWCHLAVIALWLDRNFPSELLAAPIPPDPALDVVVTVRGQFVNWETGERREVTVKPQVLWALTNELPTRTDLLRRAIKSEWRGASLFLPKIWWQWQHRTFQTLKAPKNWLVWDVSNQPLELRLSVRDNKNRLTEIKLVTVSEELASKVRNGVAQVSWRIKPTDSAVLILRGKNGVLAFLLVRWTPLVFAERVGIVADAGVVPVKIGRCDECRRGEEIARQVFLELPPLEEGFVRIYRRLKEGEPLPLSTKLPHSISEIHATIHVKGIRQLGIVGGVHVKFIRSVPSLEPQEAVKILCQELRQATPYKLPQFLPGQRGRVSTTRWEFYDIQRRRYVAVAWEVRVRYGALPSSFSSYNEAAYRTRDVAREIVKGLPLSPPNNVAAMLVERLRARIKDWRIGLMPRATLWFEGDVVKRRSEFYEPPPEGTYAQREWELSQKFVQFLRKGIVPVKFSWRDKHVDANGSVKLKWVRWLKPTKGSPPKQQIVSPSQIVFVPVNAEYEVEPRPPEGFSAPKSFRLTLETTSETLNPRFPHRIPLRLSISDREVKVGVLPHYAGRYPHLTSQLVVSVEIPLTLVYLWELRVTFNRAPVKGELTITLEGNGKRWQQKAIAELAGAWDIPVHARWLFPDPRRPGNYIASGAAVFRLIPPGRYTLRVEGTIGGKASVDISAFPSKPKIVTVREPIRQVRWQKRIEVKAGAVETIVVPLPQ